MAGWQITTDSSFKWKLAESYPANYTDEDPYDLTGKQQLFQNLQREWWQLPDEEMKLAIANAFRSTMISPQLELKWNAVAYQALMGIPASESDPQAYEDYLRDWKRKFDNPGQLDLEGGEGLSEEEVLPGERLNPPFWKNVRSLAELAPYIDELQRAALEDLESHGGRGFLFREAAMRVPGVGPKIASFAWLILQPTTSELAAIDLWMMRHLGEKGESPNNDRYFELEDKLRKERDQLYPNVPLGQYQWAVWDKLRTEGFHQPHDPFAVVNPKPYQDVSWEGPSAIQRALQKKRGPQEVSPNQFQMQFAKWTKVPAWTTPWRAPHFSATGYTIQGMTAGMSGVASGIAVRPDRESRETIEAVLNGLPGHEQDRARQRELIPEWYRTRGGKTSAPFEMNPGGVGVSYAPGVIVVAEWVDVNDNWLLYHDRVYGIISEKGGRTSHAVLVARERGIPTVVNAPNAKAINQGDQISMDGGSGTVSVNMDSLAGGEGEEAQEATVAWVWSVGYGLWQPIPPGSEGAAVLHRPMMMEMMQAGTLNRQDMAFGVIYPNGQVEMIARGLSDQPDLQEWLNSIMPISTIEETTGG